MRGFFLVIICVIADCTSLSAQTGRNQSLVSLINSIKSQSDLYFWDQYTHPNADTAKVGAIKRMKLCIEAEVSEAEYSAVADIDPYVECVSIDRGSLKQIFAYIDKKTARSILSGTVPQKVEKGDNDERNTGVLRIVRKKLRNQILCQRNTYRMHLSCGCLKPRPSVTFTSC